MPFFRVETNMGYCGTDETYIVEADSAEEAQKLVTETLYMNIMVDDAEECDEDEEGERI